MKQLITFGMLLAGLSLVTQVARGNGYTINDLYLGYSQDSAQDDYDIDLGQPGAVGVGGTAVVDLSGDFSLSTFNSVFTGGADGVLMSVVGSDNAYNQYVIWATQVRTSNFGNPAVAGSAVTAPHTSGVLSGAANTLTSILANSGGLPTAGNHVVDSTKSYTAIVDTVGTAGNFPTKSGVVPSGTIGSSSNIVMDLWKGTVSAGYVYQGYFTFDVSTGTPKFTFTPSGAPATAPVAGFSGTPTTGTAPLPVVFTDTSTGGITNLVWNFGDGHSVTNTSNANVTNTYASAGTYTVSLTVTGAGGSNTLTRTGYIVVSSSSAPTFAGISFSGGKLVISGTNGVASTQYRILMSTNLAPANWIPVFTNQFLGNGGFSYTNSSATSGNGFFRVVSP